jgi:hypothetical protein
MDQSIKSEIINNQFIYKLRTNFEIDEESYSQLITSMQHLENQISTEPVVDKEVMSYLYVIPNIIRGQIRSEYTEEKRKRLEEMEIEVDNKIIEILS